MKQRFESPTQQFESLNLELGRTRQGDSNLRVMDSNLLAKVKVEGQTKRFESSSYGFESLLAKNSNLAQAIRIPYTAIRIPNSTEALNARPSTPSTNFQVKSLSQRLVKALQQS